MTDEEWAYREGYYAFLNGTYKGDNPYDPNEQEVLWEAWKRGYDDGAFDD